MNHINGMDDLIELFDDTANAYAQVSDIPRFIGKNLIERLEDFHHFQPEKILDLGCGTSDYTKLLHGKYPAAHIVGIDISHALLLNAQILDIKQASYIQANIEQLPLRLHTFDLISANLSLLWLQDLPRYLLNIKKWLKPDGLILFSGLGIETFKEFTSPSSYDWAFSDLHTIGDALVAARWQDVVMDVDRFLAKYKNKKAAYTELKQLGLHSLLAEPPSFQDAIAADTNETFNLTWEVIYGQAWNTPSNEQTMENGEVSIPISQLFSRNK